MLKYLDLLIDLSSGDHFTSFDDLESGVRRSLPRVLFEASPKAELLMLFAYLSGSACKLLRFDPNVRYIHHMTEADLLRLVFIILLFYLFFFFLQPETAVLQVRAAGNDYVQAMARCQDLEAAGSSFRSIGDLIVAVMGTEAVPQKLEMTTVTD